METLFYGSVICSNKKKPLTEKGRFFFDFGVFSVLVLIISSGWLLGSLIGLLLGWLAGWLIGWLVAW